MSVGKEIALGVGPKDAKTIAELFYANSHTGAVRFEGAEEGAMVAEVEREEQKMQLLVDQTDGKFEYIIDGKSHVYNCDDLKKDTELFYKIIFIDATSIEATAEATLSKDDQILALKEQLVLLEQTHQDNLQQKDEIHQQQIKQKDEEIEKLGQAHQ